MRKFTIRRPSAGLISFVQRLKATLVLPLVVAIWAAGCGDGEQREAKYVERGKALFEQGDLV